jgi:hypothetical protein
MTSTAWTYKKQQFFFEIKFKKMNEKQKPHS